MPIAFAFAKAPCAMCVATMLLAGFDGLVYAYDADQSSAFIGPLAARQGLRIEGDVADQVERIEVATQFLHEDVERQPLRRSDSGITSPFGIRNLNNSNLFIRGS